MAPWILASQLSNKVGFGLSGVIFISMAKALMSILLADAILLVSSHMHLLSSMCRNGGGGPENGGKAAPNVNGNNGIGEKGGGGDTPRLISVGGFLPKKFLNQPEPSFGIFGGFRNLGKNEPCRLLLLSDLPPKPPIPGKPTTV